MKVHEVMTKDPLTIGPEASLKDVARILVERGITGLPVCDIERRVLGVVSETDLLYKAQGRPSEQHARLAWAFGAGASPEPGKLAARSAGEAMTSPAITIAPDRSVDEAARLLTEYGINRLPVVRDGELVGILTRADIVRAFLRDDESIREEIEHELLQRTLWLDPGAVEVEVDRGAVRLTGSVRTRGDADLLERLVTRVPGVVEAVSELHWRYDESTREGRRALELTA